MKPVKMIVAMTRDGGIGFKGAIPWHLPLDLQHFRDCTLKGSEAYETSDGKQNSKRNAVIMGRRTFESLKKPLDGRLNVVVSSTASLDSPEGPVVVKSLDDALAYLESRSNIDTVFVIGGKRLYEEAMSRELVTQVLVTCILNEFECDTFVRLPMHDFRCTKVSETMEENSTRFAFETHDKAPWFMRMQKRLVVRPSLEIGS
jgi:dihydrofolate reductase